MELDQDRAEKSTLTPSQVRILLQSNQDVLCPVREVKLVQIFHALFQSIVGPRGTLPFIYFYFPIQKKNYLWEHALFDDNFLLDASGGYHGFRGGMPLPQCVDDFSLPLCSQKY